MDLQVNLSELHHGLDPVALVVLVGVCLVVAIAWMVDVGWVFTAQPFPVSSYTAPSVCSNQPGFRGGDAQLHEQGSFLVAAADSKAVDYAAELLDAVVESSLDA